MTSLSLFNLGPVPSYFEPSGCHVTSRDFKNGEKNTNELIETLDKNIAIFKGQANFDRKEAKKIIKRINIYFKRHKTIDFTHKDWWLLEFQRLYIYLNELLIVNKDQTCTEESRASISEFIKLLEDLIKYKRALRYGKDLPTKPEVISIDEWKVTKDAITNVEKGVPDYKDEPCWEDCDPIEKK